MAEVSALDQTISARRRQTRSSIYRYLYEAGVPCSKQQIAAALGLSLPTVYQNLTELAAAGLIGEAGMQPSSGGRPATQLSILADARLSAGVCITRQRLRFILTDLSRRELGYKDVRHQKDVSDPDYSAFLAAQLERFLDENGVDRGKLLGVGVSLAGVISAESRSILFAPTLALRDVPFSQLLLAAKAAAPALAWLGSEEKNAAILRMADAIVRETDVILAANEADVQAAKGTISDVMLDRLRLTQARIAAMADGMRQVSALPDPVGEVLAEVRRPNGLVICKTAVPLGVVAIIYESRPNVTSDAAVLAMKSGNVCVLRGGKEAYRSAAAIVAAMHEGLREAGLPETFVNLVSDPTRRSAQELMTASGLVDLLIPRGGAGLIRACVESATVPCIETGTGICHVYVDKDADLEKALNIIENAKTSRPSVCNAEEVSLVHRDVAGAFLPRLKARLVDARAAAGKIPVELRLDTAAQAIIPGTPAGERDFDTEFLDYILAVKVVSDADEAIRHIAAHSTHHSDAIVTENAQTAERFTRLVDSAAVYVNASTRFTDGGEFGLGCEMGISTQKLHARGPMGLDELCTYKYVVRGSGQIR